MGDFAKFCLQIANSRDEATKDYVISIFEKLSKKQSDFTLEDNPIYGALCQWIDEKPPQSELMGNSNEGREIKSSELHKELKEINEEVPKSSKSFGKLFRGMKTDLRRFFFINEKKKKRTFYYIFRKKDV
jgi:hypothetical protein